MVELGFALFGAFPSFGNEPMGAVRETRPAHDALEAAGGPRRDDCHGSVRRNRDIVGEGRMVTPSGDFSDSGGEFMCMWPVFSRTHPTRLATAAVLFTYTREWQTDQESAQSHCK